jgi:hypothetical protein
MDLTYSEVKQGSLIYLPAIRLAAFSYTNFSLESPFLGVDEIEVNLLLLHEKISKSYFTFIFHQFPFFSKVLFRLHSRNQLVF